MLHPLPLPCPFCGSPETPPDLDGEAGSWSVFCADCGSHGPARPAKQEAVDGWNHRVTLVQADEGYYGDAQ